MFSHSFVEQINTFKEMIRELLEQDLWLNA
jgi:hypothetical protein